MTISGRSCRRKNKSGKSYICNVAATVLAGYALSRQDLYGRKIFNWFIAIPMWFGVGLIPTYLTINSLGLVNKLKKKMVTKLFAGVLTMCMLAGTLSGCGSADQNPADSSVQSTEVSKSAEASETTEEGNDFSEKVTLKVITRYSSGEKDWNEYYFVKQIEEKFNVDLQIEMIEDSVWGEKIALRFASKDLPDFIIGSIDTVTYGEQGFLADLTDYISAEVTPYIWQVWEDVPAAQSAMTAENGEIYCIRGVDNELRELDGCRFFINADWAKEILGKLPETTDEFYTYLKGVKERYMDGDGDTTNEIPLGGFYKQATAINVLTVMRSAFGLVDKRWQVGDDGQVFYTRGTDNYKEVLKYMNMLYEEGLLDSEFFTQTSDQFNAKDSQYLYGAFGNWTSEWNKPAEDVENGVYKMYEGMPVLTSSVNDTKMWPARDIKTISMISVMSDCENTDRVVAIADWMMSEEGFLAIMAGPQFGEDEKYPEWGYEGGKEDFTVADKNGEASTFPAEYNDYFAFLYAERIPHVSSVPFYRNWAQQLEEGSADAWLSHCTADAHSEYYKCGYPTCVTKTQEETDELALLLTDIDSYTDEMESKMILGELDIDATWDTYLEGLSQRGIEDAVKIQQAAYDRYIAR